MEKRRDSCKENQKTVARGMRARAICGQSLLAPLTLSFVALPVSYKNRAPFGCGGPAHILTFLNWTNPNFHGFYNSP